ncbi:MAG: hypothetical protein F6K47_11995 [Symploca sp. SIO2E6]|nr:hypothetical protein [Symploca sp. SIO2E6]
MIALVYSLKYFCTGARCEHYSLLITHYSLLITYSADPKYSTKIDITQSTTQ